jgi:hypothetical protein
MKNSTTIKVCYHFFDPDTLLLVHGEGGFSLVPESIKYNLTNRDDIEKHLIEIGFVKPDDCIVMQSCNSSYI